MAAKINQKEKEKALANADDKLRMELAMNAELLAAEAKIRL